MKKKKSTPEKAEQILSGLGTSGGAIGAPQLIGFGGADIQNQVMSGNIDEYASIRMRQGDTRIGESAAMPSDLDASYLKNKMGWKPPLLVLLHYKKFLTKYFRILLSSI